MLLKMLHFAFILTALTSFIGRVFLKTLKPELMHHKVIKIAPHVIDTLLLLSGVALVFQGDWLNREYDWIVSKVIMLIGYIIFGVISMRSHGITRWFGFIGALACFASIFAIAISKQGIY